MVREYMKKPIVVKAVQWLGNNMDEIADFAGEYAIFTRETSEPSSLKICTLEGNYLAREGDFIVRGIDGEFYPCKAEVFNKTYDVVEV